jgi:hypothetical protein
MKPILRPIKRDCELFQLKVWLAESERHPKLARRSRARLADGTTAGAPVCWNDGRGSSLQLIRGLAEHALVGQATTARQSYRNRRCAPIRSRDLPKIIPASKVHRDGLVDLRLSAGCPQDTVKPENAV